MKLVSRYAGFQVLLGCLVVHSVGVAVKNFMELVLTMLVVGMEMVLKPLDKMWEDVIPPVVTDNMDS